MNNIWFGTSQKGERREFTKITVFLSINSIVNTI
jgi:hypothetical protein